MIYNVDIVNIIFFILLIFSILYALILAYIAFSNRTLEKIWALIIYIMNLIILFLTEGTILYTCILLNITLSLILVIFSDHKKKIND